MRYVGFFELFPTYVRRVKLTTVFAREMKIPPAKYIDRLRVEVACQYLLETNFSLAEISDHCGMRNSESLKRLFLKTLDTTPSQYRKSFNSTL